MKPGLWQTMAALSYILYEDAMEQGLDEAEYWQEVAAQESARAMAYLDACNIMKGMGQ